MDGKPDARGPITAGLLDFLLLFWVQNLCR
jgi:hypothetical protein